MDLDNTNLNRFYTNRQQKPKNTTTKSKQETLVV